MGPTVLKRALFVLGFCLLTIAGDRLIAGFLGRAVCSSQTRFSEMYRGGKPSSIVAIGNSRGVNALYSPAIRDEIGIEAFNLSYNGMSMVIAEMLLRDYLDRNEKPRMLVLEITNLGDKNDLLQDLKLYRGLSIRIDSMLAAELPLTATTGRVMHLYNFNGEMFLRSLFYLHRSDQSWVNRYRILPSVLASVGTAAPEEPRILPENLEALRRVLALSRDEGIPTRLLVSPYLPGCVERMAGFRAWTAAVRKFTGPRVRIWDYSAAVKDPSCFADRVHMNEQGSRLFIERLKADGFFDGI